VGASRAERVGVAERRLRPNPARLSRGSRRGMGTLVPQVAEAVAEVLVAAR
jgi:hypothetical protein